MVAKVIHTKATALSCRFLSVCLNFCYHQRNYIFRQLVRIWLWKHLSFVLFLGSVLCLNCERFVKFKFRSELVNVATIKRKTVSYFLLGVSLYHEEHISLLLLWLTYKTPVCICSMTQDNGWAFGTSFLEPNSSWD